MVPHTLWDALFYVEYLLFNEPIDSYSKMAVVLEAPLNKRRFSG
jgi:hypothetical protein